MTIIDSQVHAYEANTPKRPWHSVPNWPDHVTGDEMVVAMDKVGVDGAIFISAFSMYRYDASYAVEVQRAHPRRFAIVKPVDPDDPAVGDIIADWKQTPGAVGIRIMMPNDPGLGRILRAAVKHDFPITEIVSLGADEFGASSVTEADLIRFVDAQTQVYRQVVEELTDGRKRTHWMWFIFPQLSGLGRSTMAQRYAIRDMDQARRYLADPILGDRLRHDVRLLLRHKDKSALEILGSPDDFKFRSCLTLFYEAASDESDRSLFAESLEQFYYGEPDRRTLELLKPE